VRLEKLLDFGIERAHTLCFEGSDEFLLELSTSVLPVNLEHTLCRLQEQGLRIIIAHPERYRYIQNDNSIAERLVRDGCALQLSANFAVAGRLSPIYRCAKKLLDAGYISAIASDAHVSEDYRTFKTVFEKYHGQLAHQTQENDSGRWGALSPSNDAADDAYQPKHQRKCFSAYSPELCLTGF